MLADLRHLARDVRRAPASAAMLTGDFIDDRNRAGLITLRSQ
jgi:hypothetical protein